MNSSLEALLTEPRSIPAVVPPKPRSSDGSPCGGRARLGFPSDGASKAFGFVTQFFIAYLLDKNAHRPAFEAFAILAFPVVLNDLASRIYWFKNSGDSSNLNRGLLDHAHSQASGYSSSALGPAILLDLVHRHGLETIAPEVIGFGTDHRTRRVFAGGLRRRPIHCGATGKNACRSTVQQAEHHFVMVQSVFQFHDGDFSSASHGGDGHYSSPDAGKIL